MIEGEPLSSQAHVLDRGFSGVRLLLLTEPAEGIVALGFVC